MAWNRLSGPLPRYLPALRLEYLDMARNGLGGPVAPLLQAAWSLAVLAAAGNQLNGSLPEVFRARHLEVRKGGEGREGRHVKVACSGRTMVAAVRGTWGRRTKVPLIGGRASPWHGPGSFGTVERRGTGAPIRCAQPRPLCADDASDRDCAELCPSLAPRHPPNSPCSLHQPFLLPQLLDLSSNALSGTLPASLAVARGLTALKLRNNSRLMGTLPAALGAIPGLDTLDVRDTGMQAEVAGQAGLPPFLTLHPKWVGRAGLGGVRLEMEDRSGVVT